MAKSTSKKSTNRSGRRSAQEYDLTPLVTAVCFIAAGVLFFLGNLGLLSSVGEFFHALAVGLFGMMGYVFPVALIAGAILWFVYRREVTDRELTLKLVGAIIAFVFFCVFFHAVRTQDPVAHVSAADLFRGSIDHAAGGLLGGLFARLIAGGVGRAGCAVISLIAAVVGLAILLWNVIREYLIPMIREGREAAADRRAAAEDRRADTRSRRSRYEEPEDDYEEVRPEPQDDRRRFRGVTKNTDLGAAPSVRERSEGTAGSARPARDEAVDSVPLEGTISGIDSGYRTPQPSKQRTAEKERTAPKEPRVNDGISDVALGRLDDEDLSAPEEPVPQVSHETPAPEFPLQDTPGRRTSGDISARRYWGTNAELNRIDDLHGAKSPLSNPAFPETHSEGLLYIDSETGDVYEDRPAAKHEAEDAWAEVSYGDGPESELLPEPENEPFDGDGFYTYDPLYTDDARYETGPETVEPYFENERDEEAEPPYPEEPAFEEDGPELYGRDSMDGVESRRVVTASGKVIEAEIDPNDPIASRLRDRDYEKKNPAPVKDPFAYGDETPDTIDSFEPPAGPAKEPRSTMGRARTGNFRGGSGESGGVSAVQPVRSAPAQEETAPAAQKKKKKGKPYHAPYFNMLTQPKAQGRGNDSELRETAERLQQTLRDFGVGVTVTDWQRGPSVTRYEIQPDQGVKVSKILSYADDIKLSLAVADVRIEAPIPGKSAIGIEVPNKDISSVTLREVIESEEFRKHRSKLAFAVGKDIAGKVIIADLAKMPHLLIAGTTGSGKSVCVNGLIVSMLYHAKPSEVGFIMIDPKMVELKVYEGIPHLLYPVVTDPKKAASALNWAVNEMVNRYKKFADMNVRDLKGYNQKIDEEIEAGNTDVGPKMKQIVIIVDELADLMMTSPKEVEEAIFRLAQMARAAGLHLVIVTQRPSVNVVTGTIKANIPSRIALKVASGVDSRTILDMNGAEKLIGWGDMLYYPSGAQKPVRVQGCFISDEEVTEITEFLQKMDPDDAEEREEIEIIDVAAADAGTSGGGGGNASDGADELYVEIGRFVTEAQKPVSIGLLQRKFRIGFNRAARIVDQLADEGVLSADMGDKKPREVLMSAEEFRQIYG